MGATERGEAREEMRVDMQTYIHEAATLAAKLVNDQHIASCPVGALAQRVNVLEGRFNLLIGAVVGSGALGGAVGATILKMFGG